MSDDAGEERAAIEAAQAADAEALHFALSSEGGSEEAKAFLRKQGEVAERQAELLALQAGKLRQEMPLELHHLRMRRLGDYTKSLFEVAIGLVAIVVVLGLGAMVWQASRADGIVIESFSVPPSLAQAGLTGDVVAGDMTDRLASIRRYVTQHSITGTKQIESNSNDDVHIEIPETGISLTVLWRHLRDWLGSERHVTGSVRDLGNGNVSLTVSISGDDPVAATSDVRHLGKMEDEAAERLFENIDSANYTIYLLSHDRYKEGYEAAQHWLALSDKPVEQSASLSLRSLLTRFATGDFRRAATMSRLGVSIDPDLAVTRSELAEADQLLGWDEERLQVLKPILSENRSHQEEINEGAGFTFLRADAEEFIAQLTGDFSNPAAAACTFHCSISDFLVARAIVAAHLHEPSNALRLVSLSGTEGHLGPANEANARWYAAVAQGDWTTARREMITLANVYVREDADNAAGYDALKQATQVRPRLAIADAHLGLFADAHRAVDATPADCYPCLRARGIVDMFEHKPEAATFWFARATAFAPSIPFGYAEWGEMLLQRGAYQAAAAKFALAHAKGAHFADALEMWGEALTLQNRSDLALTKFEEAGRYAPNWGRLHLKWGEALLYAGRKTEAQTQFAIASRLDLSAADTSRLAAVRARQS